MAKVKDFMAKGVLTIDKDKTVLEAAELMTQKSVGDIIVLDGEIPRLRKTHNSPKKII
jgi:predicted transcriptional regulator